MHILKGVFFHIEFFFAKSPVMNLSGTSRHWLKRKNCALWKVAMLNLNVAMLNITPLERRDVGFESYNVAMSQRWIQIFWDQSLERRDVGLNVTTLSCFKTNNYHIFRDHHFQTLTSLNCFCIIIHYRSSKGYPSIFRVP